MMMMVTMLRSSAAAAVLVFIYLCHVTANDAPARSRPPGRRCRFPSEWRGRYFQSGLGVIIIRDRHFTTKGTCIEQDRDYFLLHNRDQNCYHCLLVLRQHNNVIQYKESYCTSRSDIKVVCSQIRVETPLYTLIREPASTVRCPLHGPAYYFAYNDLVHGTCPQALSYAQPCAGHSKYQLRFNHCVPGATFNNRDIGLECLATWKDGSEMFYYGRLSAAGIVDKEDKYRCFKYHRYGNEVSLAMSADATCRGLRSATDGPFLMQLTRDVAGWPDASCRFPDWLSEVTWRDLDGQSRYGVDDDSMTFFVHSSTSSKHHHHHHHQPDDRHEFRCLQKTSENDRQIVVYAFALHNCMTTYQCIQFRKLTDNAVQFYQGGHLEHDSAFRCSSEIFDQHQLLIPRHDRQDGHEVRPVSCPGRGIHHTSPTDGCIHRLTVGCHNDHIIDIDHSCSAPGQRGITLECLATWSDDVTSTSYVIARHRHANVIDCFSFRRDRGVTLFGPDPHCGANVTSRRHDVLTYPIIRNDRCRRDPRPVDQPRTTASTLRTRRPEPPRDSSPFQRFRPSTTPTSSFPSDVLYSPGDPDYGDVDSEDQHVHHSDDDDDGDYEASGRRPSRTHPGHGRTLTGSPSLTGSSILSDDVIVDGRPKVFPAPPVHTTSGGRGHQRHVVSVTSSSASGSSAVRFPVATSFLAFALASATARFHQAITSTSY